MKSVTFPNSGIMVKNSKRCTILSTLNEIISNHKVAKSGKEIIKLIPLYHRNQNKCKYTKFKICYVKTTPSVPN